jgi:signal transduction histidine kinase
MKSIYDIENELNLKQKAYQIISKIEQYDMEDEYFEYPRFESYKSGLYLNQSTPIFTLITKSIPNLSDGYHIEEDISYLVIRIKNAKYFNANYLVVQNDFSYISVYRNSLFLLISIFILIFLLSFIFLDRFAKPFKAVNKKLDNFIKDSIHEINTPLSIINVNVDMYNRKFEANKYTNRIKAATKVLSNIYNDMDYLIKHDRVDYQIEKINLSEALEERIDYFTEIALLKDININVDIKNDVKLIINAKQLQILIDNNISNAIKYSYPNSTININLKIKNSGYLLEFIDYGIGIKDTDKLFTRYYREESTTGGFGIGLNIVKSILDQYNITLNIKSELKKGSTFSYIFPEEILSL